MRVSRTYLDIVLPTIVHKRDHLALRSPCTARICYIDDGFVYCHTVHMPRFLTHPPVSDVADRLAIVVVNFVRFSMSRDTGGDARQVFMQITCCVRKNHQVLNIMTSAVNDNARLRPASHLCH